MTSPQKCQLIVLQPQGCLNFEGGKTLETKLVSLMPQRQNLWVVDLAEVDFMDSTGLVALVTGLKVARERGCRMVLCNVQAPIRLIFELTQLDSVFEIFENYNALLTTVEATALVA